MSPQYRYIIIGVGSIVLVTCVVLAIVLSRPKTPSVISGVLASNLGYLVVDENVNADNTYVYAISYGDSNVWSPGVTVVVDAYTALCTKSPGTENFNGTCLPICDSKSTRDAITGVCQCVDPNATRDVTGTCVCNDDFVPGVITFNGINACVHKSDYDGIGLITCNGNGTAQNDGSCLCTDGYVGTNCEYSNATTCNSHGTVNALGVCTCDVGYTDARCESCAVGYIRNSSNLCELALTIESLQVTPCTSSGCANTFNITLNIAGPDKAPFKIVRDNEIILTGNVRGGYVPFNCLTATTPFGQLIKWNIFYSNFVRTFKPITDTDYSYSLTLSGLDTNGYQWYTSDVTKTSGTTTSSVVELGLLKVPQGVNLKLRGLYSASYGINNSTVNEQYSQMFTSDATPFTVGPIPPFKLTWTTTTAPTVVYSPVSNKNAIINMSPNGIYETRSYVTGSYYWVNSVQQHKFITTSVPSVQMGIQVLSATFVKVVFVLSVYTVPYVLDSTETVVEYPVIVVPARASTFNIELTLNVTSGIISWATQTFSVTQSTGTRVRRFTIYACTIPVTFPPASPVYTYLNPMPVFIRTVDEQNVTGCFDLMSIDLAGNVRDAQGVSLPALTLARDSVQSRRWQCNGTGTCTQTSSSSTTSAYATEAECLCNTCNSGVCSAVDANTKGTLASCTNAPCALILYGNDNTAAPPPPFSSLVGYHTRIAWYDEDASTTYPGKVIIPQNVVSVDAVPTLSSIGAVKFVGATYNTPRFVYYPMFIFTAIKPWVTLNSNGARILVDGGIGSDSCDVSVVLVPWGNVNANLPDPVLFAATEIRPIMSVSKTVPVVTNVFAATTAISLNGRGWSPYCPGFVNKKVQITSGLEYAIAIQATVCTDDFVHMEWTGFSKNQDGIETPNPAVTFSDA